VADIYAEVTAVGIQGLSGTAAGAGATGATGVAGASGVAGSSGAAGATGIAGASGPSGATGVSGASGVGASGISGASGYVGSDGASGVGASGIAGSSGAQGASGSTGLTGATGINGATGSAGLDGDRYHTTSLTSFTIGDSGSQTITLVDSNLDYSIGQDVVIAYDGSNRQYGNVTNFNSGTNALTFDKVRAVGSGIYSSWEVNLDGAVGIQGIQGASGIQGVTGASGISGASGYVGSDGASGVQGASGVAGASGVGADGASGAQGASGPAGADGATGTIGLTGASGTNNLVWGATGQTRTLTGYSEGGTTSTVRTAAISGGVLSLTLASFTPTVGATGLPTSSLNWDVACTGFRATADNPADILDQYVSSVASVAQVSGSVSTTLGNYSAGAYSATPAGGVDWGISYTTNDSTSYIRSTSTTISGGSASGTVTFNYYNGSAFVTWGTTATFAASWATPTHSISITNLTGNTFLQTYSSTPYTVSGTGITTSANRVYAVTATGGTVSSATGSGTFTFTTAVHKGNTGTSRYVTLDTTFTRPVAVTGTSYTATLGPTNASNPTFSFTYPTYWLWTTSVGTVPTRADIINGTGVESGVTVLGDQVKALSTQAINNTDPNPRAFWFAVRASASQPTSFKTGASAGLLSDVAYTDAGNIGLEPDSPPAGYTAEDYHLYGFTLQPGTTYVSIS
jgi:collagen type VII alpha